MAPQTLDRILRKRFGSFLQSFSKCFILFEKNEKKLYKLYNDSISYRLRGDDNAGS